MTQPLWDDAFAYHYLNGFRRAKALPRKNQAASRNQHTRGSPWWLVWNAAMIADDNFQIASINAAYLASKRPS